MRRLAPLAAALLTAPLLAACSGSSQAPDCPTVATQVNGQVDALRHAAPSAGNNPRTAATALRRIQQHLDDISGHLDGNPAAEKALGELSVAVSNVKNELDLGQRVDISPVTKGAADLSAACPAKG